MLALNLFSRAAQTFAAVQAFVARAVAHGDVAAGRAGRRVALVLERTRQREP